MTIPKDEFDPRNQDTVAWLERESNYCRGQLERGENTDYEHWQVSVGFKKKKRLAGVKQLFGDKSHCEPSRSSAVNEYVWKDSTYVEGTRFIIGKLPHRRGDPTDWENIFEAARTGNLKEIPGDVLVRYYGNIRRIGVDNLQPIGIERTVRCYWGRTGVGKSRRAWSEATLHAYPKDPRSKFWDGYRDQENVVIDEFRGDIDISHILRWFDRYPCIVEVKGSSVCLKAKLIIITSNLHPKFWYPMLDAATYDALVRRIEILELE